MPGIAKTLVQQDSSVKAGLGADSSRTGSKQGRSRDGKIHFFLRKECAVKNKTFLSSHWTRKRDLFCEFGPRGALGCFSRSSRAEQSG